MARGLTRTMLIRAALDIVDRDGLDALSMRKLGAELGVDPMAAYRHLPNKDALLDGVIEAVVSQASTGVDDTLPWQEQLRQLIDANLRTLLAHPNVLPLVAQRPLTTPGSLGLVERAFEILRGAGVPLRDAALAINVMGLLTVSLAVAKSAASTDPRSSEQFRQLFASLPRDEFPVIVEAIETGQFIENYDQILEFWVGALLGRLERVAEPAAGATAPPLAATPPPATDPPPAPARDITVRTATRDDAEALQRWATRLFAENPPGIYTRDAPTLQEEYDFIESRTAPANCTLLIALIGGEVVGALDFLGSENAQEAHGGQFGISVDSEHRGRGIGSALLAALVDWARANGIRRIEANAFASNPNAVRLYERHGFIHEGRKRGVVFRDGEYLDMLVLAKLLDG